MKTKNLHTDTETTYEVWTIGIGGKPGSLYSAGWSSKEGAETYMAAAVHAMGRKDFLIVRVVKTVTREVL